ncbi:hypothetical protein T484DRAFT_1849298 [Baffinella frigidus]|nr:hypothetical protein T484DRAFT_1849298 [Cryptophyta sp. CCMP2293]
MQNTALMHAAAPVIPKITFAEGAYLNDQDEEGNSALMHAAVHGHTEVYRPFPYPNSALL